MPSKRQDTGTELGTPPMQLTFGEISTKPPEHVPLGVQEHAEQLRESVTPVSARDFVG